MQFKIKHFLLSNRIEDTIGDDALWLIEKSMFHTKFWIFQIQMKDLIFQIQMNVREFQIQMQ